MHSRAGDAPLNPPWSTLSHLFRGGTLSPCGAVTAVGYRADNTPLDLPWREGNDVLYFATYCSSQGLAKARELALEYIANISEAVRFSRKLVMERDHVMSFLMCYIMLRPTKQALSAPIHAWIHVFFICVTRRFHTADHLKVQGRCKSNSLHGRAHQHSSGSMHSYKSCSIATRLI